VPERAFYFCIKISKNIDPAMGSGHILVYAFDVLMQIYESYGYSQRDAAKSIIENNLYGLDIDNRAYQLAYFAVMMKARQYNRRILNGETICHVFAIQESNAINRDQLKYFGFGLSDMEKNTSLLQIRELLDSYEDAKEYGSIIAVENCNWELLRKFIKSVDLNGQLSLDALGIDIAADLLALIINLGETMARKYDVVVSNPPYMGSSGMSGKLSDFVKQKYPNSKSDLFSVFIEKCIHYTKGGRFLAMITQQSWMYLSSFIELRRLILSQTEIINLLHLGSGTFEEISGEVVQSCSFIIRKQKNELRISYVINLKEYSTSNSKETAYINKNAKFYNFLMQKDYAEIPDFILAYKLNLDGLNTYRTNKLISDSFEVKRGPSLPNNDQYLRKWFEVSVENVFINPNCDKNYKWQLCTRSGSKARWFEIIDEIVKIDILPNISNFESQELAGIVWPDARFGSQAISARIKDKHVAFESGVNLIQTTSRENQYLLLAFFNTYLYEDMLSNIVNGQHFSPIYIKKLPYIELSDKKIVMLVSQIIDLLETASYNIEISPYFKSFFKLDTADFLKHCNNSREIINTTIKSVIRNEKEISNIIKQLTDIDSEDDDNSIRLFIDYYDEIKHTKSFISYFVGCLFGRYSLDFEGLVFAGGRWNASKYINYKPDSDNIIPISDEEYFKGDIVERFVEFITTLFGSETTELNLNFIAKQLGGKGNNSRDVIRNYFLKNFYKDHCQQYQKRPIYWLFDSGKQNGFKALIYMHRYDENTIGNLRIDYLHRMQRIYENEIARMQDTIENSRDAREVSAATKRKEKLIKQLQETKEYDEKIAHLALARTSIDLDDGVKVNYEKVQTDRDGKKLDVLAKI
jgi:hypothetical protein